MRGRILFVNMVLFGALLLVAWQLQSSWAQFEATRNLERMVGSVEPSAGIRDPVAGLERPRPLPQFTVIAERNLFAEERRPEADTEEAEKDGPVRAKPPKWVARPVLHGISEVGAEKRAILTEFSDQDRGGQLRTVEVGDLVQGYTVAGIEDRALILRWNEEEEVIDMGDAPAAQAAAPQGKRAKAAVTVVTVGTPPRVVVARGAGVREKQPGIEVAVVDAPTSPGLPRGAAQAVTPAQNPATGIQGERNQRPTRQPTRRR